VHARGGPRSTSATPACLRTQEPNPPQKKSVKSKSLRRKKEAREITVLIEATTFATQPVCNATRAAHALRSEIYKVQYYLQIAKPYRIAKLPRALFD
jgi:hypothetical protein